MNAANRYAEIAERELKEGTVRLPLWEEVLAEADGVTERARELYRKRRISENLAIEREHFAATEVLRRRQKFNDSLALRFPHKNVLLGIGVALVLIAAYFLMSR